MALIQSWGGIQLGHAMPGLRARQVFLAASWPSSRRRAVVVLAPCGADRADRDAGPRRLPGRSAILLARVYVLAQVARPKAYA